MQTLLERIDAQNQWERDNPEQEPHLLHFFGLPHNINIDEWGQDLIESLSLNELLREHLVPQLEDGSKEKVQIMPDNFPKLIAQAIVSRFPDDLLVQGAVTYSIISSVQNAALDFCRNYMQRKNMPASFMEAMQEAIGSLEDKQYEEAQDKTEEILGGIGESTRNREESNP